METQRLMVGVAADGSRRRAAGEWLRRDEWLGQTGGLEGRSQLG